MVSYNPVHRFAILVASLFLLATVPVAAEEGFCLKCLFKCPKHDDSYGPACMRSVIPPWPICKFHSVEDFVEHAQDSATRCCGDDTSACRCPHKKSAKFLNHIDEWCKGVASCGCRGGEGEGCPPQNDNSEGTPMLEDTMATEEEVA